MRALYCMSTLHNPLGWVLDLQPRQQRVSIAREHGLILLEDAAYAFLAEPLGEDVRADQITMVLGSLDKNALHVALLRGRWVVAGY